MGALRATALGALLAASPGACQPVFDHALDLRYATARAPRQTDPRTVAVSEADGDRPYHVLGDVEVRGYQVGSLGEPPTRANVVAALREQAARLGADAVILVRYGEVGLGAISVRELEVRGRAVRF